LNIYRATNVQFQFNENKYFVKEPYKCKRWQKTKNIYTNTLAKYVFDRI